MPLFFIIPIAVGALTLGATTTDVTTDTRLENRARAAQTQQIQQGQMYQTMAECQQAAAAQGMSANVCQPKS